MTGGGYRQYCAAMLVDLKRLDGIEIDQNDRSCFDANKLAETLLEQIKQQRQKDGIASSASSIERYKQICAELVRRNQLENGGTLTKGIGTTRWSTKWINWF